MRDIGKNIRQLRIQSKMTQDELARKLFVTRQTVSNYENGKSRPDIEMLERIAQVLNADLETVLYGPQKSYEVRRLGILCIAAVIAGILLAVLIPTAQEMARNTVRLGFLSQLILVFVPLYFLLLGWLAAKFLAAGLKWKPLSLRWVGLVLAAFLLCWFILMAVCYWGYPIAWMERAVWALYVFCYRMHIPYNAFYLLPGAALWLLGFPPQRKKANM